MKRLIKKAYTEQKADPNSWQYKALEEAGYDMSRATLRNGEGSYYDVSSSPNLESKGYKYIETNSSDDTCGCYTNGENVIVRIAGGYVDIYKLGPNAKKFIEENPDKLFDILNSSLEQ